MWMKSLNLLLTAVLAAWIATRKRPQDGLVPLILSGLNAIPLFILGNSANGSVFCVDVALATYILRFGWSCGRDMTLLAGQRRVLGVFMLLVVWIAFSGTIACFDESRVAKFTTYGMARWGMFLVLIIVFFGQRLTDSELLHHLRVLAVALIPYGCLCLAHQHGVIDLAGSETLGERAAEAIEAELTSEDTDYALGHRRFLGMTSANIGSVCALGAWVPLALWARTRRTHGLWPLLAIVMCWCLIGTWSRSNVMGLLAALLVGAGMYLRFLTGSGRLAFLACALAVSAACLAYCMLMPQSLQNSTSDRYLGTLTEYSSGGTGTGGHRFREHGRILRYLLDHPHLAVSGLGANGYRRLMWHDAATMLFGHNIYLHTLYELGAPGMLLLAIWLSRVARLGLPTLSPGPRQGYTGAQETAVLVLALVVQRLVAGWGADTLFATEGMLQSNVLFLALAGLAFSAHGATPLPEEACRMDEPWMIVTT